MDDLTEQGPSVSFAEDGTIKEIGRFVGGERAGIWENIDDENLTSVVYDPPGTFHEIFWRYLDGNPELRRIFTAGKMSKLEFFKDGKLVCFKSFEGDDETIVKKTFLTPTGQIEELVDYIDGVEEKFSFFEELILSSL